MKETDPLSDTLCARESTKKNAQNNNITYFMCFSRFCSPGFWKLFFL